MITRPNPADANKKSLLRRLRSSTISVIAPQGLCPRGFGQLSIDGDQYESTIAEVQRFRGRIYVDDGAISADALDPTGRQISDDDARSWHVIIRDEGAITGCVRMIPHGWRVTLPELSLFPCVVRMDLESAEAYARSLSRLLNVAHEDVLPVYEVGGMAVDPEFRKSVRALLLVCAGWSIAELVSGGGIGVSMATAKHDWSSVLLRMGGGPLPDDRGHALPAYWDPHYDCEMSMMFFDSRCPSFDFQPTIEDLTGRIRSCTLIATAQCHRAAA